MNEKNIFININLNGNLKFIKSFVQKYHKIKSKICDNKVTIQDQIKLKIGIKKRFHKKLKIVTIIFIFKSLFCFSEATKV